MHVVIPTEARRARGSRRSRRPRRPARLRRRVGPLWWAGGIVLSVCLLFMGGVTYAMRASLPRADGRLALAGLSAPVQVSRDGLGIPTLRAATFEDAARALGFIHGQERFFQMDLTRRAAAGELSALFGPVAVAVDREARALRYRAQARRVLGELPVRQRRLLGAYAAGVNAGLADLGARPPEYFLLRARPERWKPEDSLLVVYYMFAMLAGNGAFEGPLGVMRATLPDALFEFLTPETSRFDAPLLLGAAGDPRGGYRPAPIPGPEVVDLRGAARVRPGRDVVRTYGDLVPGSNNWVVAGSRTAHGGALLANDPHLPLAVPNIWYRAELVWGGRTARGATLPGVPGVVIGATDDLAWGVTNGMADQVDLVTVEVDTADPSRYLAPDGPEPFRTDVEWIRVNGGEPVRLELRATRWGPVVGEDWRGRPLALRSPAYDAGGINLDLLDLAFARTVEKGIEVGRRWRGPALNLLLADRDGRIAWVLTGFIPRRTGFDGKVPVSWASGDVGWDGPLDEALRPVIIDPPSGVLFTANQRTVDRGRSGRISHVWVSPTRARRIAELLGSRRDLDERDLLAMQLDTRSLEHDPVRDLVLEVVAPDDPDPLLRRVRAHVAAWNGTADADQVGFRLLQAYTEALRERILVPLLAPAIEADPDFVYNWLLAHEPVFRILEERPAHLLPPGHASWPAFLRQTLLDAMRAIETGEAPGIDAPWGAVNRAAIQHPIGRFVPALAPLLDMASDPLPGWPGAIRAQAPDYGASLRIVVGPGHLDSALFHMPGGQSGHFLSPHYRDGHAAWVQGEPTPLRAGPARTSFVLTPLVTRPATTGSPEDAR